MSIFVTMHINTCTRSMILIFFKTPKYDFAKGFHDSEDVVYSEYLPHISRCPIRCLETYMKY